MADGNFNRSHLPVNSYKSGHEAGTAQMRMRAIQAFRELLSSEAFQTDEKTKDALMSAFREKLK